MTTTDTSSEMDATVPPTTSDVTNQGHNHDMQAACTTGCPEYPPPPKSVTPGK
ncbi:MAG TPA: hypothetical protein VEO01_10745 [Pseudonocardiaceae bacterium]|nr:hypothetical protein [Pseudonocardiaceae bacterium]